RAEHGQWDRDGDDYGRAPAAEKQQDHDAGERSGNDALVGHRGDCAADNQRNTQVVGQRVLDLDQLVLDAGNDGQRRGRAILKHLQQHGPVAVDVHDVGLRRIAVAHLGNVAHVDDRTIDRLDGQTGQVFQFGGRIVELDRIFKGADLLGTNGEDQVLGGERVGDV